MIRLAFYTAIIAIAWVTAASAQYGGPPMWSRDYRDYRDVPHRYGPQSVPCIYTGRCRGTGSEYLPPRPYPRHMPRVLPAPRYREEW